MNKTKTFKPWIFTNGLQSLPEDAVTTEAKLAFILKRPALLIGQSKEKKLGERQEIQTPKAS